MEQHNKRMAGSKLRRDMFTLGRAVLSALLLVLAGAVGSSAFLRVFIPIIAALICGLDVLLGGVDKAVRKKDYLNEQLLLSVSAIASFCAGCYNETVIMLAVYQVCRAALGFAVRKTREDFTDFALNGDPDSATIIKSVISTPSGSGSTTADKYLPYFKLFSKAAFVVGLLYAIFVPMITDMTYVMSIRRGAMLVVAAVPLSALAALPVYSMAGLARSAGFGVIMKNSEALESAGKLAAVVYDKTDVFTDGVPKIVSLSSPLLDSKSFAQLAAYTVYFSQQRFAAAVMSAYSGDINPSYISDFRDIPGCGAEAVIHGKQVVIGTAELFDARSIPIPDADRKSGFVLHLAVSGIYAGSMTLKENVNPYAQSVISDLSAMGGVKSVLVTDDGREVSERLAQTLGIDELHYECDEAEKADIIQRCRDDMPPEQTLMYISAKEHDYHSAADIDARIGSMFGSADAVMTSVGLFGLPVAYEAANTARRLSSISLIATIVIKLLLVILALTGGATLWFIMLLDFAVTILSVLLTARFSPRSTNDSADDAE